MTVNTATFTLEGHAKGSKGPQGMHINFSPPWRTVHLIGVTSLLPAPVNVWYEHSL